MASDVVDDVVVGAGVVGLTTALLLARGGHRVVVVTAEPVGGGSSGRSLGVVSQLHGTAYRRLSAESARKNAAAYRAMNAAGFALLEDLLEATGTAHERHDAWLVASHADGAVRVDDEHLAASRAGLRLEKLQRSPELPFEHHGALRLRDQIVVDPARLLSALAIAATEAGVRIVERERVVDVRVRPKAVSVVETGQGEYAARHVVLATGTPILDRGLYALKTAAFRMVAVTGASTTELPVVTAIGPEGSTTASPTADGRLAAVGQAHAVGTGGSELHRADRVEAALRRMAPDFVRADAWSGQDYRPFNPIAFVGLLPRGGGAVSFASGFDGWGLTQGAAAGVRISRDLLGLHRPAWATTIGRRVTRPRSQTVGLAADVRAASELVSSFRRLAPTDLPLLRDGQGVVHRTDDGLVATSLTGDVLRSVAASCSRAGGIVAWNDLEGSWDCPVCGSRFDVDGSVLEGGARGPLRPVATPGAPGASSGR
ncbi:FAD-dependent oxidoreductase [Amnibacterium kyonggiense]|uniref:Glycine/D-amino acid oxidase-like deaminating enzyme n=1 Tax=Amnibacterium kyonggiense TaxID=595671 RepID=A0A4V3EAH8_9MICO|nr:FAD-dependent oxidoreductase [Amnibacterium kyonggiense]TDS75718.1 glycine/D-amino acid oxidase-like deaminating enzyme [Amnibacterium kyonggiense]